MKRKVSILAAVLALLIIGSLVVLPSLLDHPISTEDDSYSFVIGWDGPVLKSTLVLNGTEISESGDAGEVIQNTIDAAHPGEKILLKAGYYNIQRDILLLNGTSIHGEGNQTVIGSSSGGRIMSYSASNIHLDGFKLIENTTILIIASRVSVSNVTLSDITATVTNRQSAAFFLYAANNSISDVSFENCHAIDCDTYGFLNFGDKGQSLIKNILYSKCSAVNCGRVDRPNDWVAGFVLAEGVDVENMTLKDCGAVRCWESGFHVEMDVNTQAVTFQNCIASENGIDKPRPLYGHGFLVGGNTTLVDCRALNNANEGIYTFADPNTVKLVNTYSTN